MAGLGGDRFGELEWPNTGDRWRQRIGWFLNSASSQSYQQVVVRDILEDVPVARMMRKNPPTVAAGASVNSLVYDHVMGTDECGFPVVDGDRLVGMVTLQDLRDVSRDRWEQTAVREIMTSVEDLATLEPEGDAADALQALTRRDVRQLVVLEGCRLSGYMLQDLGVLASYRRGIEILWQTLARPSFSLSSRW